MSTPGTRAKPRRPDEAAGRTPHVRAARRALALIALAGALFAAAAAPATAAASTASANAASSNAASSNAATSNTAAVPPVAKPAPAPPAGVAVGRQYVPKMDSAPQGTVSPLVTWSVTLTASPTELWPTQYTTLTAKANHTVSGTIYYIDILDDSNTILAACGAGTTCSVAVTSLTPGIVDYTAYISNSPTDVTGSHYVTYSGGEDVDWFGDDIALTASKYTVAVGTSVVLKEKASSDIGSTPFYVQLWDTTDGTLLNQCATGTTCSATVSQSAATTHSYVATFAGYATSYPPPIPQGASAVNYITWSASGIQVSLTAPAVTVNGPETVTATSTVNVGSTPYYIEIFDENGTRIAACGTGTTCSVSYTPSGRGSNLIAFVSGYSSALPPTSIQASSNAVHTVYERLT